MTPDVTDLLWRAAEAGVVLEAVAGRLHYQGPKAALTELLPAIKESRDEIVAALSPLAEDGVAGPALTLVLETERHGIVIRTYVDTAGETWTHIVWETGSEWRRAAALDLGPKEKAA